MAVVGASAGRDEGEDDGLVCPVTLITGVTLSGQVRTEIVSYFKDRGELCPVRCPCHGADKMHICRKWKCWYLLRKIVGHMCNVKAV